MLDPKNGLPPETNISALVLNDHNPDSGDHDSSFPPLPKNAKRKMIHLDTFNAGNMQTLVHEPESSISYKEKVQGFGTDLDTMDDLSLDDIDIDSEDDLEGDGEEEDALCPRICLTKMEKAILRKP